MKLTKVVSILILGLFLTTLSPDIGALAATNFDLDSKPAEPSTNPTTPVKPFTQKPKNWTVNSDPNKGSTLPTVTYDTSAPSGTLDVRLTPSTTEATKDPVIVDVDVYQSQRYELRYADIPTLDYVLEGHTENTYGDASAVTQDKKVTFDANGVMSGTGDGAINGHINSDYKTNQIDLASLDINESIQAWHGSGGVWWFTYMNGGQTKKFSLTDAQIPVYFTGTQKTFTEDISNSYTLPSAVKDFINKYGVSKLKVVATPKLQGSVANNNVSYSISGSNIIVTYRPVFHYDTNSWWTGSPVQNEFYNWVHMPKVRDGYGYNALSILGGNWSMKFTEALRNALYKGSDGNGWFNLDKTIEIGSMQGETAYRNANTIWSESTLWYGGNMGLLFDYPITLHFYGLLGNTDQGSLKGTGSGTVSGTVVKYEPIYGKDADGNTIVTGYKSVYDTRNTNYKGDIVAGADISLNGSMKGDVSSNVDVDVAGTLKGGSKLTGWTTNEIIRYNLNAVPGTTYKKPYIIPISTQITLPDGTKVDGNKAEFTVTQNGVYTVKVTDIGGNVATQKITINNIDKGRLDVEQYYVEKAYSGDNIVKTLKIQPIEENSTVRAYTMSYAYPSENKVYGFFLRVKEAALGFDTKTAGQFGGLNLAIKNTNDSSISDSVAKSFYDPSQTLESKRDSSVMLNLLKKQDGIYISNETTDGYKTVFFKATQPFNEESDKYIKLQFTSQAGSVYETVTRLQIEDTVSNYVVPDNNYILSLSQKDTLVFTRNKDLNLKNVVTIYDSSLNSINANITSTDTSLRTSYNTATHISNTFKDDILYQMALRLTSSPIQRFKVATYANSYEDKSDIRDIYTGNNINNLDIIYEPIDTILNTTSLVTSKSGNEVSVLFNPTIKTTAALNEVLNKHGVKSTDFKLAIVNYGQLKDTQVANLSDYMTESEILRDSKYTLDSQINITTSTSDNIKLLFGIPGKFTDSVSLENNLSVALPNVNDNVPTILELSSNNPFIVQVTIENNGTSYTLPQDFDRLKSDGKIRSLNLNGKELIGASKETLVKELSIAAEGIYKYKVSTTNTYGATRTVEKTANIIDANIIANGSRLDNDSTIVITKHGLYDLQSGKFSAYAINNSVLADKGYSIKGIRLLNNNIVIIDTAGKEGEVFSSDLTGIGKFQLNNGGLDLIEYRDKIYFAEGSYGISSIDSEKYKNTVNGIPEIDHTIEGPVYAVDTYSNTLLVGSEGLKALRTYRLDSNKLSLVDMLTSDDIYGEPSLKVNNITLRNGRLELYPDRSDFHIVIDLP